MKVLFFIDTLRSGGKERRLVELLKWLTSRKEITYELIVMSDDIHYKEIHDLGLKIHFLIRKTRKDIFILNRINKVFRSFKPDIVHCWDSMTAVYSVPLCKLQKIKLINGMVIDSPLKRNIFNQYWLRARLTFPFSDVIVGNSAAGLDAYKAPPHKSIVIHSGFDFRRTENILPAEEIRKQLNVSNGYIIGMVASFSGYKDYPTYYEAAKILLNKRSDLTFLAIGSDTDSDESLSLISDEYRSHFRLLGKKQGIESYVKVMDICVLSTFTEGVSNSILEYMAFGKPVIATRGGGTSEVLIDNQTGFLIDPSDPRMLAEKMEVLLTDEKLRKKMGSSGKKLIEDAFSIEKMSLTYIDLYKKVSGS